jgi:predicted outer membrane repeat protein
MENTNEIERMGLVHRAVALGLAVVTTGFIATSVAVVFTGNTATVGGALASLAIAPLRAAFGG